MAVNTGNPLSSGSLATFMAASLPTETPPHLRDPYDAVALFSHACMIAIGFRLIGLGEEHKIEASREASDPSPLPQEWNSTSTSTYAFRYAHTQSSLEYLIKITRLGQKAVINALGIGDDRVHSLDLLIKDFFSPPRFPYTTPAAPSNAENTKHIACALQDLFISAGRISDLGALFKLRIIQKIAPGLGKPGYEDTSSSSTTPTGGATDRRDHPPPDRRDPPPQHDPLRSDDRAPPARPYPFDDPLAAAPRRPFPAGDFPAPGFEDEYEINRPPGRGGIGGERRPLNIGERDLYPQGLGPRDPLRGGGFGGGIGGGGMHPTFEDPMFGGVGGVGGTGGYGSAPPGARYDPVGPGDGPPNLRGGTRFPRGGGGFGTGGPPNPFGGFGEGDFI